MRRPDVTFALVVTFETIDDACWFLHAAGRSVGDVQVLAGSRLFWEVRATRGTEEIVAQAPDQTVAWREAAEQAAELVEW